MEYKKRINEIDFKEHKKIMIKMFEINLKNEILSKSRNSKKQSFSFWKNVQQHSLGKTAHLQLLSNAGTPLNSVLQTCPLPIAHCPSSKAFHKSMLQICLLPIARCLLTGRTLMKNGLQTCLLPIACCLLLLTSCDSNTSKNTQTITYTCPMPEDSVFRDKPGKCPKCGMDLVPLSDVQHAVHYDDHHPVASAGYTCPMHPKVHSDTPGECPICGMDLERVKTGDEPLSLSLEMLLKPANQAVVTNVPMVHMAQREENLEVEVLGNVEYNPEFSKRISSKIDGRITKLFVKYRFQKVRAGEPLMEVYSQDMVAAQNNYLFLLQNDAQNHSLIDAARQKLSLLGMSARQLLDIQKTGKAKYAITVYSPATGVIDELLPANNAGQIVSSDRSPLKIKEGAYVAKGEALFTLLNPSRARVSLQIFPQHQEMLKKGDRVRIQPEANRDADFRALISEIVPYYQPQSNTLIARIPFDNSQKKLPVGSTVKAVVFTGYKNAWWLPEEAVTSLGLDKVVFVRSQEGFIARKVKTGIVSRHLIQILEGLQPNEAVAANAGFLVDSESFIMTKTEKK